MGVHRLLIVVSEHVQCFQLREATRCGFVNCFDFITLKIYKLRFAARYMIVLKRLMIARVNITKLITCDRTKLQCNRNQEDVLLLLDIPHAHCYCTASSMGYSVK